MGESQTITTDSDGRYQFDGLDLGTFQISIDGGTASARTVFVVDNLEESVEIDLQANLPTSIVGSVTDNDGNPVADAVISLRSRNEFVSITTSASDGTYQFLISRPGTYEVDIAANAGTVLDGGPIEVTEASNAEIVSVFGTGQIALAVTDGSSPAGLVTASLYQRIDGAFRRRSTNEYESGLVIFDKLAAGEYSIRVATSGGHGAETTLLLMDGEDVSQSLTLIPQYVFIGQIHFGNSPVANATVTLRSTSDPSVLFSTTTRFDGTYSLKGIPNDLYRLVVFAKGKQPSIEQNVAVSTDTVKDVELTDANAFVSGLVVDEMGNPLSDVTVVLRNTDGTLLSVGKADSSGQFQVESPVDQSVRMTASLTGYVDVTASGIQVTAGETVSIGTVTLQSAAVAVSAVPVNGATTSNDIDTNQKSRLVSPVSQSSRQSAPGWLSSVFFDYDKLPNHIEIADIPPLPEDCDFCASKRQAVVSAARVQGQMFSRVMDRESEFDKLILPTLGAIAAETSIAAGRIAETILRFHPLARNLENLTSRAEKFLDAKKFAGILDAANQLGSGLRDVQQVTNSAGQASGPNNFLSAATKANRIWLGLKADSLRLINLLNAAFQFAKEEAADQLNLVGDIYSTLADLNDIARLLNGENVFFSTVKSVCRCDFECKGRI